MRGLVNGPSVVYFLFSCSLVKYFKRNELIINAVEVSLLHSKLIA